MSLAKYKGCDRLKFMLKILPVLGDQSVSEYLVLYSSWLLS